MAAGENDVAHLVDLVGEVLVQQGDDSLGETVFDFGSGDLDSWFFEVYHLYTDMRIKYK